MIVRRFPQRTGWHEVTPYSDAAANVDTTDPNVPNVLNKKKYVRLNGRIYEKPVIPPTESPYERRRREIVENFSTPTLEQEINYEQQVNLQNQARVQDFINRGSRENQNSRTVVLKEAIKAANTAQNAAITAGRTPDQAEKDANDAAQAVVMAAGFKGKEAVNLAREATLDALRENTRDRVILDAIAAAQAAYQAALVNGLNNQRALINARTVATTTAVTNALNAGFNQAEANALGRQAATDSRLQGLDDKIEDSTTKIERVLEDKYKRLLQIIADQESRGETRLNKKAADIISEIQRTLNTVSAPRVTASGKTEDQVDYEASSISGSLASSFERSVASVPSFRPTLQSLISSSPRNPPTPEEAQQEEPEIPEETPIEEDTFLSKLPPDDNPAESAPTSFTMFVENAVLVPSKEKKFKVDQFVRIKNYDKLNGGALNGKFVQIKDINQYGTAFYFKTGGWHSQRPEETSRTYPDKKGAPPGFEFGDPYELVYIPEETIPPGSKLVTELIDKNLFYRNRDKNPVVADRAIESVLQEFYSTVRKKK